MKMTYWRSISCLTVSVLLLGTTAGFARVEQDGSGLTKTLQEKLQNLPHGLSRQKSLFVRFRHVDSVQFFGAGLASKYTFQHNQTLLPEGLSLNLKNTGKESWANGIIHFKQPLDLSKYNSMVIWAKAAQPNTRVWMGLRTDDLQARTDILPLNGFPPGEIVELVIPLSRFFSKPRINLAWITHMTFEFGEDTVGNKKQQALQIYGVAFVRQAQPVAHAELILNRARPQAVIVESTKALSAEDREQSAQPRAIRVARSADETPQLSQLGRSVKNFLNMTESQAASFFKSMGFDFDSSDKHESVVKKPLKQPDTYSREYIQPYARSWPVIAYADERAGNSTPLAPEPEPRSANGYLLLLLAAFVGWVLWVRRRRHGYPTGLGLGKVWHEIHWPFVTLQAPTKRVERDFWKGVAAQRTRFCWLSVTDMVIERNTPERYFGEDFLRRQIALAAKSNVKLFPSLSFTQNIFAKDALVSNPQRAMMALRTLVAETLDRFSDVAPGVRIEDATSFLNSNLKLSKNALTNHHEFWKDIIATVKAKRPHFLFIADAVGEQPSAIRKVGFDYFENDHLVSSLLSHLKESTADGLEPLLTGEAVKNLPNSIYNIYPLLAEAEAPGDEHGHRQHVLAALLLTLLPGVAQHEGYLPDELERFVDRIFRSSVLRKGDFAYLPTSSPSVLAFARWHKKSLFIATANFSFGEKDVIVNLAPLQSGLDNDKLYLFNNALHGSNVLTTLLHQPQSNGPALALWGQNLKDSGFPLTLPGLSLSLFSVSLARPITPVLTESLERQGSSYASVK
jgi:hypothetical protein